MEKVSKDHTVEFNGTSILTTVTNDSCKVEVVLHELRVSLAATTDRVVGFDIKYKTNTSNNNSITILQLCHGTRCLIIQLPRLDSMPNSLIRFFGDKTIRFIGVGISQGFTRLSNEYDSMYRCINGFELAPTVDEIRYETHENSIQNLEFSELTAEVLRVVYLKPAVVEQSDWGAGDLTSEQVKYAALDAYVPFAIMNKLSKEKRYKGNYLPALGIYI